MTAIETSSRGMRRSRVPAEVDAWSEKIIAAAIEVHRTLGPGFLESVYEQSMAKAVEALSNVHEAQVISYLKAANLKLGLLLNFNVALMRHGLRRVVHPDYFK